MIYIGIDPGQKGYLAALLPDNNVILQAICNKKEVDTKNICYYIQSLYNCDIGKLRFAIEKVHAMPKQGVVSMFNFGKQYGQIIGIVESFFWGENPDRWPIYVTPQTWKKTILKGYTWKGNKWASVEYTQKKYPEVFENIKNKQLMTGIADAICLAEYSRLKYETNN